MLAVEVASCRPWRAARELPGCEGRGTRLKAYALCRREVFLLDSAFPITNSSIV